MNKTETRATLMQGVEEHLEQFDAEKLSSMIMRSLINNTAD